MEQRQEGATSPDLSRQDAMIPGILEKYVARLEGEVEFLREENATKNAQIKELTERSRESATEERADGARAFEAPHIAIADELGAAFLCADLGITSEPAPITRNISIIG